MIKRAINADGKEYLTTDQSNELLPDNISKIKSIIMKSFALVFKVHPDSLVAVIWTDGDAVPMQFVSPHLPINEISRLLHQSEGNRNLN